MERIAKLRMLLRLRREGVAKEERIETVAQESGEDLDGTEDGDEGGLIDEPVDDLTTAFPQQEEQ